MDSTQCPAGALAPTPGASEADSDAQRAAMNGPRFLAGRTALVTGAASGIGRACALALAGAGAHVYVVDRAAMAAKEVAEEINGTAHVVDLSDPQAVDGLPDDADIVVNNAGLQHLAPVHDFPPECFVLLQKVMVEAPFRIIRRTLPHMYERGWGRIVNISSVHGLRASAYKAAYVTAKHGLEGLSKVVALEGAPYGVTSNCVNPGYSA
jgi:3-hydroxybutyrate dehydrogenase